MVSLSSTKAVVDGVNPDVYLAVLDIRISSRYPLHVDDDEPVTVGSLKCVPNHKSFVDVPNTVFVVEVP
jgi:hypothetical protein